MGDNLSHPTRIKVLMVLLEDKIPDTSATSYFSMICVNCHDKATHESCCINLKYLSRNLSDFSDCIKLLNQRTTNWADLGLKSQSYPFFLKIVTQSFSKILILIPTLVF